MQWLAVYTAPNAEADVNARLQTRLALETFYPFERVKKPRRRAGGQRGVVSVETERALFPSYTFARASAGALRAINDTPGVSCIVSCRGEPLPVPDAVIGAMRALVDADGCFSQKDFTKPSTFFKGKVGDGVAFSRDDSILSGIVGIISDLSRLDSQGVITTWIQMFGSTREVRVPVTSVEEIIPQHLAS